MPGLSVPPSATPTSTRNGCPSCTPTLCTVSRAPTEERAGALLAEGGDEVGPHNLHDAQPQVVLANRTQTLCQNTR
jgi:hypothetical protein